MAEIKNIKRVLLEDLKPYEKNARLHSEEQVQKIADSITAFGFLNPCIIDKKNNVLAGHGRIEAAKLLGLKDVPCVYVEGLSDEERRAYILADNRLAEMLEWDMEIVNEEINNLIIEDFDFNITGFDVSVDADWFDERKRDDDSRQEGNDEYSEFLDKFEQPKTTDDCYTPECVYDAVKNWVCEKFGIIEANIVRPFYPGGDYQNEIYTKDSVVIDNPPFSIMSEIMRWYAEHKVRFFLFAPGILLFSTAQEETCTAVPTGISVTYENGATVPTSFVSNLYGEDVKVQLEPELTQIVNEAAGEYAKGLTKTLPKYEYPHEVLTAARATYLAKYGESLTLRKQDCVRIAQLDAQKECGKTVYGGAYLLAERAAAERAAAERAAAERAAAERAAVEVWELSDREREIVNSLGKDE